MPYTNSVFVVEDADTKLARLLAKGPKVDSGGAGVEPKPIVRLQQRLYISRDYC
jgi:hypothetical protein